jgi:pyruvate formate lyase activating enzyme
MKIFGLQKMTLLDFPGRVACTVFLGGCNFRCPFCHNAELFDGTAQPLMDDAALLAFLEKRKGILDGVCITGGEPTLHPGLPELLRAIKKLGYPVKLDTNGYRPEVVEKLLEEGLVDYVAMDIKNGPQQYAATCGLAEMDLTTIERSIRLLTGGAVDYEFRTTVVKELHNEETIAQMGNWLRNTAGSPVKRLFLQSFVDRDTVKFAGLSAPEAAEMQQFQAILAPFAEKVEIRGS